MMFYHILVETSERDESSSNKQYYKLDVRDKTKLLGKSVMPYLKRQALRINGYRTDDAYRFIVTESDLSTEIIVENVRKDPRTDQSLALFYSGEETSKANQYTQDVIDDILEEAQSLSSTTVSEPRKELPISSNKVFIAHGRDRDLFTQVENVLRALGLEPIILQEQASVGETIIEKIKECIDIGFDIILYTSCDESHLKPEDGELKSRVEQNVVLEHGYLMAKLGRERACYLVGKNTRFLSDIQGLDYIPANDFGRWKYKAVEELKAARFDIDMDKF